MKFNYQKILLLLSTTIFLLHHHFVHGQTTLSNGTTLDNSLIQYWDSSLNFTGCYEDLAASDKDGNGYVQQNEYLTFIQTYGKRKCFSEDALTLQQSGVFNSLACICRDQTGSAADCCLGDNAKIPTAGAADPSTATPDQNTYLTSVCKLTDATIDSSCPPVVNDRGEPAVAVLNPDGTPVATGGKDKLPWWAWLLIAAAILFLLCCCCGFALRKQRKKEDEEAQEDEAILANTEAKEVTPKEIDPEQPVTTIPPTTTVENGADDLMMEIPVEPFEEEPDLDVPAHVAPIIATTVARGGVVGDDSEEEEEERRKRGGNLIPDEDDPDRVIYRGAPPFPPPENPPKPPRPLKPIPDKENESDEWDQPGRNIEYPVEKDDMSAGEVEHYEPDGGVHWPQRPTKDPLDWNREWNRAKPEEPDDMDNRKHRIQMGLGEGEVWNKLDEESAHFTPNRGGNDAFDWVIQSALGAIGTDASKHNRDGNPQSKLAAIDDTEEFN